MNFSEVADALHISREGSRKRILKYENDEQLKPYLIYDKDNKLIGLHDEGIEVLRTIGANRRSFSQERNVIEYKHQIELKTLENSSLNDRIKDQLQYITHLEQEIDDLKGENTRLREELKAIKGMNFWKRLTYKG